MSEIAPKKTPLYQEHVRLGAKIVPFAGWLMPVQYTSIMEEHQAVRDNVGMFDISHMGQLVVAATPSSQKVGGEGAAATWLNTMLTNNIDKLDIGMGQYTFLLNERRAHGRRFCLAAKSPQDGAISRSPQWRTALLRQAYGGRGDRRSLHARKSKRGVRRRRDSGAARGGIISGTLR